MTEQHASRDARNSGVIALLGAAGRDADGVPEMGGRSTTVTRTVLVVGASGWLGSRVLPLLARQPYVVRCLESWPEHLRGKVPDGVELIRAEADEPVSLAAALDGVDTAFYLLHAESASGETADQDRKGAEAFGRAARTAGVRRLVYFGGFGAPPAAGGMCGSVGDALRASGVPVIEFRASIIVGPGSLCFGLIRSLVERLPVLPAPRWARAPVRPIAIDDVLACLVEAVDLPVDTHRTHVLVGPEPIAFHELMREYARTRGLRRLAVPLPGDLRRLFGLATAIVAPDYARIGRKVVDALRSGAPATAVGLPAESAVRPVGVREALARAIRLEEAEFEHASWSSALTAEESVRRWGGARYRNRFVDSRVVTVGAPARRAFSAVEGIGGAHGWYSTRWLWQLRGWMDRMVGGVGMSRGRRDPDRLVVGDVVDCWRVVALEPGRLLLAAEMKLPGQGWLEFEAREAADGRTTTLRQTASFDPLGLMGLIYWWLVWPAHQLIFAQMVHGLAARAEQDGVRTEGPV